jgi:transglutaminase-like putative cysteine protease
MRRLCIEHVTEYVFHQLVSLLEHRLLLRPREDHGVRIASSQLAITPAATIRWQRDALNNSVAIASFSGKANRLRIASSVVIDHYDEAPLDFLVDERGVTHPFFYDRRDAELLAPFLVPSWSDDGAAVGRWLHDLGLGREPTETFTLLDSVNGEIHRRVRYEARDEPGVQSPAQTIARGVGSCRDLAALFVDASRHLGLASRFVSGYCHTPGAEHEGAGSTHAWAEVYLPGPGWKGFDPTGGQLTGADHIAVAVARDAQRVPPVAGSFIGVVEPPPLLHVSVRVSPA